MKNSNPSEEYKRTTLYLRDEMKRDYERWFGMLELNLLDFDSSIIETAEKREMHEAMIATAMLHSDEFISLLKSRHYDSDEFDQEVESCFL
jgi:hypothetical protein